VSGAIAVIVNADDLGLHPAVRRSVEECAALGTVTSASVLANGPDTAEVRPIAGVSLGAHLNILRGVPLSPASEVPSLVGSDGRFHGRVSSLAWRLARGALALGEVRLEWSRQVALLRERGLVLSHVDGERHTHCLPGLFDIACEVAREHGIAWIRRSDERFGNPMFGAPAVRRMLLRAACVRSPLPRGMRAADSVWGIAEQGAAFSAAACARALRSAPAAPSGAVIEVVCHPARREPGDPALPGAFGRMRVEQLWEHEHRSLADGSWLEAAAANGWRLTAFDRIDPTR